LRPRHCVGGLGGTLSSCSQEMVSDVVMITEGAHWEEWYGVNGIDHGGFFKEIRRRGMELSREAVAGLLVWEPDGDGDGFNLTWHALFSTGRAHEVMGYNEVTQARLDEERAETKRRRGMRRSQVATGVHLHLRAEVICSRLSTVAGYLTALDDHLTLLSRTGCQTRRLPWAYVSCGID